MEVGLTRMTGVGSVRSHEELRRPSETPLLEPRMQFREIGSSFGSFVPAFDHHGIDVRRTAIRTRKEVVHSYHSNDFLIAKSFVRLTTVSVNFPKNDSKSIDIRSEGVSGVLESFLREPSERDSRPGRQLKSSI